MHNKWSLPHLPFETTLHPPCIIASITEFRTLAIWAEPLIKRSWCFLASRLCLDPYTLTTLSSVGHITCGSLNFISSGDALRKMIYPALSYEKLLFQNNACDYYCLTYRRHSLDHVIVRECNQRCWKFCLCSRKWLTFILMSRSAGDKVKLGKQDALKTLVYNLQLTIEAKKASK